MYRQINSNSTSPTDRVCLGNISVNTLHKGKNVNSNNNNKLILITPCSVPPSDAAKTAKADRPICFAYSSSLLCYSARFELAESASLPFWAWHSHCSTGDPVFVSHSLALTCLCYIPVRPYCTRHSPYKIPLSLTASLPAAQGLDWHKLSVCCTRYIILSS